MRRVQTVSGAHPTSYPIGNSLRVKWPGREADNSPPFSAEVKNARSYTSIHPYVFKVWYLVKPWDTFTSILSLPCVLHSPSIHPILLDLVALIIFGELYGSKHVLSLICFWLLREYNFDFLLLPPNVPFCNGNLKYPSVTKSNPTFLQPGLAYNKFINLSYLLEKLLNNCNKSWESVN